MSINLKVEEYCQNCPDFEPETELKHERVEMVDHTTLENKYVSFYETYISCKYCRRCAAQMRYLQKQHDEMMKKKETGSND